MFEKFKVYTATEINSRTEILLENYSKVINIEALTMIDMCRKKIIPSAISYTKSLCDAVISKNAIGIDAKLEKKMAQKLNELTENIAADVELLESKVSLAQSQPEGVEMARCYRNEVFAQMQKLRVLVDEAETMVSSEAWPFPSYSTLLYSI
jgi:glutamine synthetase